MRTWPQRRRRVPLLGSLRHSTRDWINRATRLVLGTQCVCPRVRTTKCSSKALVPKSETWRADRLSYDFVSKCSRIVGEKSRADENSSLTETKCSVPAPECSRATWANPLIGHRKTHIGDRNADIASRKPLFEDQRGDTGTRRMHVATRRSLAQERAAAPSPGSRATVAAPLRPGASRVLPPTPAHERP